MDLIRSSFLRRGGDDNAINQAEPTGLTGGLEQQQLGENVGDSNASQSNRFSFLRRPPMPWLFTPRPSSSRYSREDNQTTAGDDYETDVVASSTRSTRFHLSSLVPVIPRDRRALEDEEEGIAEEGEAEQRFGYGNTVEISSPSAFGQHQHLPQQQAVPAAAAPGTPLISMNPADDPALPGATASGARDRLSRFRGVDPEETLLADLAETGRRRRDRQMKEKEQRRREHGGSSSRSRERSGVKSKVRGGKKSSKKRKAVGSRSAKKSKTRSGKKERKRSPSEEKQRKRTQSETKQKKKKRRKNRDPPTSFLFCFPWVASQKLRSQILRAFVSGAFLFTLLTVYLALAITKTITTSTFSILFIMIILCATAAFCYTIVRVCMTVAQRDRERKAAEARARDLEAGGVGADGLPGRHPGVDAHGNPHMRQHKYAVPQQPIRVLLARDEEAAGIESETAGMEPPAYGVWRESVRMDPNLVYWQRNADYDPASSALSPGLPSQLSHPPAGHLQQQNQQQSSAGNGVVDGTATSSSHLAAPPHTPMFPANGLPSPLSPSSITSSQRAGATPIPSPSPLNSPEFPYHHQQHHYHNNNNNNDGPLASTAAAAAAGVAEPDLAMHPYFQSQNQSAAPAVVEPRALPRVHDPLRPEILDDDVAVSGGRGDFYQHELYLNQREALQQQQQQQQQGGVGGGEVVDEHEEYWNALRRHQEQQQQQQLQLQHQYQQHGRSGTFGGDNQLHPLPQRYDGATTAPAASTTSFAYADYSRYSGYGDNNNASSTYDNNNNNNNNYYYYYPGEVDATNRPPSYASDEGVDYVVDARPRSIAPREAAAAAAVAADSYSSGGGGGGGGGGGSRSGRTRGARRGGGGGGAASAAAALLRRDSRVGEGEVVL